MKRLHLIIIFLFSLGVIFLFRIESVSALTISPPVKEINGNPGEKVSGIIRIYNETNSDLTVSSSVTDFKAKDGEGGEPQIVELDEKDVKKMSSWVNVAAGPIEVKSLDWQNVLFEINIPQDAEPGGHYAAVFFSPQKVNANNGEVGVDYQTGSLILLDVSGDVKKEGTIKDFYPQNNKKFYEYIPVNFELRIANSGNVHFKPGGTVNINNMLGGRVSEIEILKTTSGGNILPQSIRRYDVIWGETDPKNLPKNFLEKIAYEWKNLYFGRYKAEANVILPQGNSETRVTYIWIIPWQLIIVMILALIAVLFLFRTYNRWIIKKAREGQSNQSF